MELKPLKESRTAILDIETEDASVDSFVEKPEQKKQEAKKVLFENNTPDIYMENLKKNFSTSTVISQATPKIKLQFEAAETFFAEEPKKSKKQAEGQVSFSTYLKDPEPIVENVTEIKNFQKESKLDFINVAESPEVEIENNTDITNEIEQEENIERLKRGKTHINFKARLKIIVFGFCAILACVIGWSIYNAVEIKTLTAEMESSTKTYSVNIVRYIKDLSKTDDLINPDSIFNLPQLAEAEVVPLTPSALEKPVEYSVKSNWFDRMCNWLSNLFN